MLLISNFNTINVNNVICFFIVLLRLIEIPNFNTNYVNNDMIVL